MQALPQFDDANLIVIFDDDSRDIDDVVESRQAVRFAVLIEGVEDLNAHRTRWYVADRAIAEVHLDVGVDVKV